jgi:hypothetical protein
VAPWGAFAVAHSRPPWASMIERQIESPLPVPPDLVVMERSPLNHETAGLGTVFIGPESCSTTDQFLINWILVNGYIPTKSELGRRRGHGHGKDVPLALTPMPSAVSR